MLYKDLPIRLSADFSTETGRAEDSVGPDIESAKRKKMLIKNIIFSKTILQKWGGN